MIRIMKTILVYQVMMLLAVVVFSAHALAPSPTDLAWLKSQCGDGALFYVSAGKVYLAELSTGTTITVGSVANGWSCEISPDASKLAWVDGTTVRGALRKKPGEVHTIISGVKADAGVHWVDNDNIAVVKNGKWYSVTLTGSATEIPKLTALGTCDWECDVKRGADGIWSYITNNSSGQPKWKTSDGKSGTSPGHCSSSLSPDAKSITSLENGHKKAYLTSIRTGGISGTISWVYDYSGTKGFDNQRWSSNDSRFIVSQDEKYNYMTIMKRGGTKVTRMGKQGSGEMYGDFSVGSPNNDPWPISGGTTPTLGLSPTSLQFSAEEGSTNPPSQSVIASASGGLSLASIVVTENTAWLSVLVSGSGTSRTLTNSIDISGLTANTYAATITVAADGKTKTYNVSLNIDVPTVEPPFTILSPNGGEIYKIGQEITIRWKASQTAGITGADLHISPNNGKNWYPINTVGSFFIEDSLWGTYAWTIPTEISGASLISTTALIKIVEYNESSLTDKSDGTFSIIDPSAIHIKMNAGANTVSGWESQASYVSGGSNFSTTASIDLNNAQNPAPMELYQTVRRRISPADYPSFRFSNLPNGEYLVRLHNAEPAYQPTDATGNRNMTFTIEGKVVLQNYDVVAAAGGGLKVDIQEFKVMVSDGNGMSIALDGNGGDAFVAGIEIFSTQSTGIIISPSIQPLKLNIMQNPARGVIQLKLDNSHSQSSDSKLVIVTDLHGKVVFQQEVTKFLSIRNLPSGMYTIRFKLRDRIYTKTVMFMKE